MHLNLINWKTRNTIFVKINPIIHEREKSCNVTHDEDKGVRVEKKYHKTKGLITLLAKEGPAPS